MELKEAGTRQAIQLDGVEVARTTEESPERGFSASDDYRLSSGWGGRRAFGLLKDI